jgi:adenylate cyclase class 2
MNERHQREIEIKFRIAAFEPLRVRLRAVGGRLVDSGHESNLIFDDPAGRLRASGRLLRLRRDRRALLTFKEPVAGGDPRLKVRREVEVEVSDFGSAREILEGLGYRVSVGYEKERETWQLHGAEVCLDELTFGRFVEIEGEPAAIERIATELGFDLKHGITRSYLDLQTEARQSSPPATNA